MRRYQRDFGVGSVISASNLAVRQCLLEFRHAFVGDFGAANPQLSQIGEGRKLF